MVPGNGAQPAPAGPDEAPKKTVDEVVAELNKSPLFMTELEENDDIAALQALAYEGTPLENALSFKDQGNECFAAKRWADAKEFYNKGIAILVQEEKRLAELKSGEGKESAEKAKEKGKESAIDEDALSPEDEAEEIRKQQALLETLYANRAASHLELKNYRACTLDCAATLRLNPKNLKAYYRSAKALLELGKLVEAEDACRHGLRLDPNNASLKNIQDTMEKRRKVREAKEKKEAARLAAEKQKEDQLRLALRKRGIRNRITNKPPELEDAVLHLVPNDDDEGDGQSSSTLSVPVLLMYPLHAQTDFIKAFLETDRLQQHFGYIFPLPWDKQGEFVPKTVETYAENRNGNLVRVLPDQPLLLLLANTANEVELVDGMLKLFVVPGKRAAEFKAMQKARVGKAGA